MDDSIKTFWKFFKKFWVWFFRWPTWYEIGAAILLLLTVIHQLMLPLGIFWVLLICILVFLILSGLWGLRLVYRLFLLLPVIVKKFGRPYAGPSSSNMAVFRWGCWPVVVVLMILTVRQEDAIKRSGFRMWKPEFTDIVMSENPQKYSDKWIGWYPIDKVEREKETGAVKFQIGGDFISVGGFLYSPEAKPKGTECDADDPYSCKPIGDGWYVWYETFSAD